MTNLSAFKASDHTSGRNLSQDQYWKSLEQSFDKNFIQEAQAKYGITRTQKSK